MELFANIVSYWKPLAIFAKSSVVDLSLGCEYASGMSKINCNLKAVLTVLIFLGKKFGGNLSFPGV